MIGIGIAFVATVIAVTDGDTFKVQVSPERPTFRVRLAYANSLEKGEIGWRNARANLESLVLGKTVTCEITGFNEDRPVAQCLRQEDNLDVGRAQVQAGMAWDCPKFSNGLYAADEPTGMSPPSDGTRKMCNR